MSLPSPPNLMSRSVVAALVVYNVLLSVFAIYTLMSIWPTASNDSRVGLLGFSFQFPNEVRLMLMVVMAGALGSFVHTATSLVTYIGNRESSLAGDCGIWFAHS